MIYVSTACLACLRISDAITGLFQAGFREIELSGGTDDYEGLEKDLETFRCQGVSFLVHNYFPPPREHFVMNLGSLDDEIYHRTLEQLKRGVDISYQLGSDRFSFHAGAFMDTRVTDLGTPVHSGKLYDRDRSLRRFYDGFRVLKDYAGGLRLYVENHVFWPSVQKAFGDRKPLMLTCYKDFLEMRRELDFTPLLDVAHLCISSQALGLDFAQELAALASLTDYVHVGEVDEGLSQDRPLSKGGKIFSALKDLPLAGKTLTLEINGTLAQIRNSYDLLKDIT